MEIKEFISETLVQINEGIKSAKDKSGKRYYVSNGSTGVKGVSFSLAVTSSTSKSETKQKGGGAHIKVLEAKLQNENTDSRLLESLSRLEFNVIVP